MVRANRVFERLALRPSRARTGASPDDDLQALKDIDKRIGIGIGVVDVKVNHVESADEIARSIEAAERVVGERVQWIHPDCGFWMLPRSVADRKMKQLVAGRDLHEGRSVR